jgi:shikimate kinase
VPIPGTTIQRILLVGFMGTGKSTIGAQLGRSIGWTFVDSDKIVESRAGKPIPRIFAEDGEEHFREIEDEVMRESLGRTGIVLASGGGWPCRPGRMELIDGDTLAIWLRADPRRILARVKRGRVVRPLLKVEEPLRRIRELLGEREPYYRRALWWVDTGIRSPAEVVRLVSDRLRTEPGRPLRA